MVTPPPSVSPIRWVYSRLLSSKRQPSLSARVQAFFASLVNPSSHKPTLSRTCCHGLDVSSDLNFAARELSPISPSSITNVSIAQNTLGLCSAVNLVCGAQGMANAYHQFKQASLIDSQAGKRDAITGIISNFMRIPAGIGFVGYQATAITSCILKSTKGMSSATLTLANFALLLTGMISFCAFFVILGVVSSYKLYKNYSFKQELFSAEKSGKMIPFLQKKLSIDPKEFGAKFSSQEKRKFLETNGKKLIKQDYDHLSEEEKAQILENKIPDEWKEFYTSRLKQFGLKEKMDLPSLIALEHEYKKALLRKESALASLTSYQVVEDLKAIKEGSSVEQTNEVALQALSANRSNIKLHAILIGTCILTTLFIGLMCFTAPWIPLATLALAAVVLPLMTAIDYHFFKTSLEQMKVVGTKDFIANGLFAVATIATLAAGIAGVILLHLAIGPLAPLILLGLIEVFWVYYKHQKLKEKEEELAQRSLSQDSPP